MSRSVKVLGYVLAVFLLISMLSGCSEGETPIAAETVKGSVQAWGNIHVLVPDGMTLSGGSLIDHNDPDALWIQLDENQMHYFLINIVDEKTAVSSVETTKEMNSDTKDVTLALNGTAWTGVSYQYAGLSDCFQMWAPMGEKFVLVQAAWFAYDSAEAKAILESISIS